MKRLLTILFLLLLPTAVRAQTVFVPNCGGSNDTTAFSNLITAAGANTATISLPYKSGTRCAVNSLTVPSNITLSNENGVGIKVNTGQILTVRGPVISPPDKQLFFNATAGLGTVTFSGSALPRHVFSQWWGSALTHAPIQAAITAMDSTLGGTVTIDRGTYVVGAGIFSYGKSNLTIEGRGKGETILEGTVGSMTAPSGIPSADGNWGVLTIDAAAGFASPATNIKVRDLTVKLVGGTPGALATDQGNGTYYIKTLHFGYVTGITFERIKIDGSRWEALYTDSTSSNFASNIRVLNSDFANTQHNAFNINTAYVTDFIIRGNLFDTCAIGVQVVGRNGLIQGNNFKNPKQSAVLVGEANYASPTARTQNVTVDSNIVTGLGTANTVTSNVYGIQTGAGESAYGDGTYDNGIVVSNNQVLNSVKTATNVGPLIPFVIGGAAKVTGNLVSGYYKAGGATGTATAYSLVTATASGTARAETFFENNTLAYPLTGDLIDIGIRITGKSTSSFYLSGNKITKVAATNYALEVAPTSGTPFVSLDGDILNGYIYYPSIWTIAGPTVVNFTADLDNKPLYGTSSPARLRHAFGNVIGIENWAQGAIASATSITPLTNFFVISGTTTINTIVTTNLKLGTPFMFVTTSALTFDETGNIDVTGGTSLVTTANYLGIGVWDGTKVRIR